MTLTHTINGITVIVNYDRKENTVDEIKEVLVDGRPIGERTMLALEKSIEEIVSKVDWRELARLEKISA